MHPRIIALPTIVAILSLPALVPAQTPMDTSFTYQGQIKKDGSPFTGNCDFIFVLYSTSTGGHAVPLNINAVTVDNGFFTAMLDFGAVAGHPSEMPCRQRQLCRT
jgi:hypothetical protein